MNVFSLLITTPLGYILSTIYSLVQNYGVAILIFTVVVKLILMPLLAKQQKSMQQMQKLQPQLEKIQKKYANDKNKLQQETMKIYQDNKVNPAGGCLPLLIQFPIIIGLYQVITKPLQYILHLDVNVIEQIAKVLNFEYPRTSQIVIANAISEKSALIQEKLGYAVEAINFDFFGLDLSAAPDLKFISWLWIIPILSAVTSYISSIITRQLSGNTTAANEQMKTMNIVMPLMSGYFCFIMPAGVGVYWIASNVVQVIQQAILTWYYKRKDEKGSNE
ncbi:MAG: YidC/Oxa1 family membrane protein insertase [Clostridia bacterium]|nr:YidC/Oxa1 family membrane protein insertase [Clostridia bacterium]